MKVIKHGAPAANGWTHLEDAAPIPATPFTVTLGRWRNERDTLQTLPQPVGVRIGAAEAPEELADDLAGLPLVVLDMATFTDGRVFTQARLLRERLGFAGELRARGDFLRDQMFFLQRVGVNAFEFPEETDLTDRLGAFREFTVTYQAAVDTPEPLFRRRAA